MKKKITYSVFEKNGRLPRGIYVQGKGNSWYPVIYFRKAKHADKKIYELLFKVLHD